MEKLAIQIQPLRVSKKTKGFNIDLNPGTKTPNSDEPEFEDPLEDADELEPEYVDAVAEFGRRS